jgi:hypothetical protein
MTVISHPFCSPHLAHCDFSQFPRWKIKLEDPHFDKIEVVDAELQVLLIVFREDDY